MSDYVFRDGRRLRARGGPVNILVQDRGGAARPIENRDPEREDALAAAFQEGHAAGEAAVRQELESQLQACRAQLASCGEALPQSLGGCLAELERQTVQEISGLVTGIVTTILRRPDSHTEVALAAMREALADLGGGGEVIVNLHPRDAEVLVAGGQFPDGLRIVPDPGLQPGDAMLSTTRGLIDGRLATRLEPLLSAMEEICAEHARKLAAESAS